MGQFEKPGVERADTDRSLRDERGKMDQEVEQLREVIQRTREAESERQADTGSSGLSEQAQQARIIAELFTVERRQTDLHLQRERVCSDVAVAARDGFVGMVSHELRNSMGSIAFEVALLTRQAPASADDRKSAGKRIQRQIACMNRLLCDLLDVASIDAGKFHVEPGVHPAVHLLRDTMDAFQPLAAAKDLTLTAETPKGLLLAKFDAERILQVLNNLVGNAIKFTKSGGSIVIRLEPIDGEVRFSVTDTGVGLPAAHHRAVFERFWQENPKASPSLGLGLYISRCIVEAHGGRVWVESEPGEGSTFYFTLPAASADPKL